MCSVLCLQHMGSVSKKKKKTVSAAWSVARIFAGTQFVCQRGCMYIYTYSLYLWTWCVTRLIYTKHITSHSQDTITLCTISRPISLFFFGDTLFFFFFLARHILVRISCTSPKHFFCAPSQDIFFIFFPFPPKVIFDLYTTHHLKSRLSADVMCD